MSLMVVSSPIKYYSETLRENFSHIKAKIQTSFKTFHDHKIFKQFEHTILTTEQYHQFLTDQHEICIALDKNMLGCINENLSFLSLYKFKKVYDLKRDLSFFECKREVSQAAVNYIKYLNCLRKQRTTQKSIANYYAKFFIDLQMNASFQQNLNKTFPSNFFTFESGDLANEINLFDERFAKISLSISELCFIKGCEEAFGYLVKVFQATLNAK